jgi:hypothetical protein
MTTKLKLGTKNVKSFDSECWARTVTLEDGRQFRVFVNRGNRVRIPYKPRGQNIGYQWHADVYEVGGRRIAGFLVTKSLGVRGILKRAEIIN